MLTDLSFLNNGQKWPPASEQERLQMYADNKALFKGDHAVVWREQLERIERYIDDFNQRVSYPIVMNFQRLMSLKIADLLLGERPKITISDEIAQEQTTIDTIIEISDLMNVAYQVAIDVSRYGDGLFQISMKDGKPKIGLTQPPIWFPVVSPDDIQEIVYHVLAWETPDGTMLKVRIHSKGAIEEQEYRIDNHTILSQLSTKTVQTGLSDFAIIQVSNVLTSDECTGADDYTNIDSTLSDLMVRFGQIDKILDKHAEPAMTGPQSALEQDPLSGQWRFKKGNYFPRDSNDDPMPSYLTWDAQLTANFKQIDNLLNLLYGLSEMGSALFGESSGQTGQVLTASALHIKMTVPLAKVNRIRMRFDPAMKKAVSLCSEMGAGLTKIDNKDISIQWFDGLPKDEEADARILASRTGNKATMSQYRALQIYDQLTDEQADEELAKINSENALDAPFTAPPGADTAGNNVTEPKAQDQLNNLNYKGEN